jgi:hypothetical protein
MFDLLIEIYSAKRDAVERKEKSLPQEYLDDIRARYRQIVADGFNENAGETKGKTIALLERLKNLEDAAISFAVDFSVDFTNNNSEISLRDLKIMLRVIGQFKTLLGLEDYCIAQSFFDTSRKQGRNPYDMMRVLLTGGDIIEAVFGVDKAAQIKPMLRLTNAIAAGDTYEKNAALAEMPTPPTKELLEAASYGPFKPYNEPPPEKKNSSPAVPKDKMKAAREIDSRKKSQAISVPPTVFPQRKADSPLNDKKRKIRAGPLSA